MSTVFRNPTYGAASGPPPCNGKPPSQVAVIQQPPLQSAREIPADLRAGCSGSSQPPRQQSPLSPTAAILLPDARNSHDLDREHESTRPEEGIKIDNMIELLRVGPNASDAMKNDFKSLFIEHYLKPERPDTPEVQEKLSLELMNTTPFNRGCRALSVAEKCEIKQILKNLLDRGIIRKSNSKFISTMGVMAVNGTYRLQINYGYLNERIVPDGHPLPCIAEQLITIGNKKQYFSMIELEDAHYHIDIEEEFMKYTSFMTPEAHYEFTKMPLGLKIEAAQFQRFMQAVVSELVDTAELLVTMNGILVATETTEGHLQILKRVFEQFVRNKIAIAFDKCKFLYNEIEYFNYLISLDGVRPSTKGLEAIRQFPIPTNHEELNRFIKLCKYFKKFIKGFELIAEPLRELQPKNRNFEFGERQIEAFETLKVKLISAPTLAIFKLEDETELHCDASPRGFGAVLLQRKDDNEMHPIFYFSQRTTPIEKTYGSDQLERCAVGYAVQRFTTYLRGMKFKIVTDADSVRRVLNRNKLDFKTDAWIRNELWPLDYVFEHRSRDQMEHVDALSRPMDSP